MPVRDRKATLNGASNMFAALGSTKVAVVALSGVGAIGANLRRSSELTISGTLASELAESVNHVKPKVEVIWADSRVMDNLVTNDSGHNLLSYNDSSFETSVTGWQAYFATCVLARTTTTSLYGVASLQHTIAGTGGSRHISPTVSVSPNTSYTFSTWTKAAATGRTFRVSVRWYDDASSPISFVDSGDFTNNTSTWTQGSLTTTSPSNAVYAAISVDFPSPTVDGQVHYFDGYMISKLTTLNWEPGDNADLPSDAITFFSPAQAGNTNERSSFRWAICDALDSGGNTITTDSNHRLMETQSTFLDNDDERGWWGRHISGSDKRFISPQWIQHEFDQRPATHLRFTQSEIYGQFAKYKIQYKNASNAWTDVVGGVTNLLSVDNSSFDNSIGTWAIVSGTSSIAISSTTVRNGARAMEAVMAASGTSVISTPTGTSGIAVSPSASYSFLIHSRAATTTRSINVAVCWYDSAGTQIGARVDGTATANSSSAWTAHTLTATSPSNAAYAAIQVVTATVASETHYFDSAAVYAGTYTSWIRGGEGPVRDVTAGAFQEDIEIDAGNVVDIKGIRLYVTETKYASDFAKLQELSPIYKDNISTDIITLDINKVKESNDSTNPLGVTGSNSINLTLDNTSRKYNPTGSSTFADFIEKDVKFIISLGWVLNDDSVEYISQGTYYADDWQISSDGMTVSVSARDYSKFLQEKNIETGYLLEDVTGSEAVQYLALLGGVPEVDLIERGNSPYRFKYLFGNEISVWDAMLEVATADIGMFFFDEANKFVYENRDYVYGLTSPEHTISDSNYIVSGEKRVELQANKIIVKLNSIDAKQTLSSVWRAESSASLVTSKLTAELSSYGTTATITSVENPLWVSGGGFFKVDNEIIKYTGVNASTNTLTGLVRGQFGTTAAKHLVNTTVREARQFKIEYSNAPVVRIQEPLIIAKSFDKTVDIDKFVWGPYSAEIVVSVASSVAPGKTILLEGTDPTTELNYYFALSGVPFSIGESKTTEASETNSNPNSVRRHKVKDITIENQFVQTSEQAKSIITFLMDKFQNPVPVLSVQTWGIPHIQLSDLVRISSFAQLNITNTDYFVVECNITYDGGVSQTLELRKKP